MKKTPFHVPTVKDLIYKRRYQEAQKLLQSALENTPNTKKTQRAHIHYFLGVLFYFQNKISKSLSHFKKSLHYDAHFTDAAICLSVALNDIGHYQEAKTFFEKANQSISFETDSPQMKETIHQFVLKHLELGDLYLRYRKYDLAIEEYSKALLLSPQVLEIRLRRAKAYQKKGFLSRAIEELKWLKREHPNFLESTIQLGLLYSAHGQCLEAELEWEEVLKKAPHHPRARALLENLKKSRPTSSLPPPPAPSLTL